MVDDPDVPLESVDDRIIEDDEDAVFDEDYGESVDNMDDVFDNEVDEDSDDLDEDDC
jgi:hypothetical protein